MKTSGPWRSSTIGAVLIGDGGDLCVGRARPLTVVFAGFTLWLVAAARTTLGDAGGVPVMLSGLLAATRVTLPDAGRIKAWCRYGRAVLCGSSGSTWGGAASRSGSICPPPSS